MRLSRTGSNPARMLERLPLSNFFAHHASSTGETETKIRSQLSGQCSSGQGSTFWRQYPGPAAGMTRPVRGTSGSSFTVALNSSTPERATTVVPSSTPMTAASSGCMRTPSEPPYSQSRKDLRDCTPSPGWAGNSSGYTLYG